VWREGGSHLKTSNEWFIDGTGRWEERRERGRVILQFDDAKKREQGQGEDMEEASKATHKDVVNHGFLLDVVIAEGAVILKLLSNKDEALPIGRHSLSLLNLELERPDRVIPLDLEWDHCPCERLDKDLHGVRCSWVLMI